MIPFLLASTLSCSSAEGFSRLAFSLRGMLVFCNRRRCLSRPEAGVHQALIRDHVATSSISSRLHLRQANELARRQIASSPRSWRLLRCRTTGSARQARCRRCRPEACSRGARGRTTRRTRSRRRRPHCPCLRT